MSEIIITLEQLRSLIGLRMIHQGQRCQVIEVLEDGPSLVLQGLDESPTIQPNQHGEATRRSPVTYTIRYSTRTTRSCPANFWRWI